MATNLFQQTQYIVDAALVQFINSLGFIKSANREFEGNFTKERYASGSTVNFRLPNMFVGGEGSTMTPEAMVDRTVPLTIEKQFHVGMDLTSAQFTFNIRKDELMVERYIKPAMIRLADQCEQYVVDKLLLSNRFVGTAGSGISSFDVINNARVNLTKYGVPTDSRFAGIEAVSLGNVQNSMKNFFNNSINTGILRRGYVGQLAEMDTFESVHLGTHTSGVGDTNPAVNGLIPCGAVKTAVSSGGTIVLKGLANNTTGVVLQGDIIQLTGVYGINPVTLESTGLPAQFSVLEDADSNGSGEATISVSPAVISSSTSPYKNVSSVIPVDTVVKLVASHTVSMAYHRDAVCVAMPAMSELGPGTISATAMSPEHKIALRYTRGSNVYEDKRVSRVDVLIGATFNPQYATRIVG